MNTNSNGVKQIHGFGSIKRYWRIILLIRQIFKSKKVPSLAQSLAYTSILSLVPILAIFFSVLGIITGSQTVQTNIREFISNYFIPEYVSNIFDKLESLSSSSIALGAIGFPTLFLAGVFLYVKVDSSINEIWHAEQQKQWFKNSLAFFMTLFFGPMLLVLVFSIPPYLQTLPYYQEVISQTYINALVTLMVPIFVSTIGLFVLYTYIPNVPVEYMAAFKGAFVASVLIQASNLMVSWYLKNFSSYNLIYGSLAMIPIFLLWVFVLWLVVLVGSTLAFIIQYYKGTGYLAMEEKESDESLLCSALRVMVYLCQSFQQHDGAPDFDQIHLMLGLSRDRLSLILNTLLQERLITRFEEKSKKGNTVYRFQPGVSAEMIYLNELIPLFYRPKEQIVFGADLNRVLGKMEVHPGFFDEDRNLKEFLDSPDRVEMALEN